MSNLNQDAQPNKPLGSGAQAGVASENRILYVLLFVLIGVFFWKVSSDDNETKTIAKDDFMMSSIEYEEVLSTTNPNVDVEIMDADLLAKAESNTPEQNNDEITPEKSKINPDFYKSYNLKQMPITNDDGFDNIPAYDYNYIFAGNINVPEGTFAGIDNEGFAMLRERKRTRSLIGGGIAQAQHILPDEFYPKGGSSVYTDKSSPNTYTTGEAGSSSNTFTKQTADYPSTGIPYGIDTYPLDDTLDWHPYESLAYKRDKKKAFVAKKVMEMPSARDLEPYIPPSTLGDRDTRMGYGVVIRPRR